MAALILTVPNESTDPNQPIAYPDAIMTSGTRWMFDFLNTACNANPSGALSNGAVFTNLVPGAPAATFASVGGDASCTNVFSNGKPAGLVFTANTGACNINLGTTYDLSAINPPFIVVAWGKPSALANNGALVNLGTSTGATNQQLSIEGFSGGARMAGITGGITLSATSNNAEIAQWALSWSPSGVAQLFKNGVLVAQGAAGSTLFNAASYSTRIGTNGSPVQFKGTVYRAFLERLDISNRSAAAVVADDYAANIGRFS